MLGTARYEKAGKRGGEEEIGLLGGSSSTEVERVVKTGRVLRGLEGEMECDSCERELEGAEEKEEVEGAEGAEENGEEEEETMGISEGDRVVKGKRAVVVVVVVVVVTGTWGEEG